jgi:hypothetical protein
LGIGVNLFLQCLRSHFDSVRAAVSFIVLQFAKQQF